MNLIFCNKNTQYYKKNANSNKQVKMRKKAMNGYYRKVSMNLEGLANSKASCGSCGGR